METVSLYSMFLRMKTLDVDRTDEYWNSPFPRGFSCNPSRRQTTAAAYWIGRLISDSGAAWRTTVALSLNINERQGDRGPATKSYVSCGTIRLYSNSVLAFACCPSLYTFAPVRSLCLHAIFRHGLHNAFSFVDIFDNPFVPACTRLTEHWSAMRQAVTLSSWSKRNQLLALRS